MTFEFVIVYQREEGTSIRDVLTDRMSRVLTDNLNECDFEAVDRMVRVNFERVPPAENGEAHPSAQRVVLGFSLELPDDIESARTVIDEFAGAMLAPPIEHVVKFEDPLLHQELRLRAEELFALEMKLRRVLSAIYLHAYRDQPYNLLREEAVDPMKPPPEEQMRNVAENEFFFLTFGQYIGLNHRPDIKQLPKIVELIRASDSYEALRMELYRRPVEDEDDSVFVAGLKERMDAIEAMRNCVAHNRRPSNTIAENYINARPQVEKDLDDFLAHWPPAWEDYEMYWETATREAVERALETAEWDDAYKTVTFYNPDDRRINETVDTREDFEAYLRAVASTAFYCNAPAGEDEFEPRCDERGVVDNALGAFEERLESFFPKTMKGDLEGDGGQNA